MGIELGPERAGNLAREAYLFGFPLVYIATQIDVLTHVTKPQGARAPINQFAHYRAFPDASNKTVVGFNVDTLYSLAQLDVSAEPLVLSVPAMGDRFWIMQLSTPGTTCPAAPGSRTRRRRGRRLRDRRTRLGGRAAAGAGRAALAHEPGDRRRPDLHRRPGRLRGRARAAGSASARPALGLGQRLRRRRPRCR